MGRLILILFHKHIKCFGNDKSLEARNVQIGATILFQSCVNSERRPATSGRKQRNSTLPGNFSGRRSVNTNQQKLSSNYYLPHTFPLDGTITVTPAARSSAVCTSISRSVQFPHPVTDGVHSLHNAAAPSPTGRVYTSQFGLCRIYITIYNARAHALNLSLEMLY